jgi:hypothetical protein
MTDSSFKFTIRSAPRESDFHAQVEAIKQVASWDGQFWYCRIDRTDAERLAEVTNHLFTVTRQYGTYVRLEVIEG